MCSATVKVVFFLKEVLFVLSSECRITQEEGEETPR